MEQGRSRTFPDLFRFISLSLGLCWINGAFFRHFGHEIVDQEEEVDAVCLLEFAYSATMMSRMVHTAFSTPCPALNNQDASIVEACFLDFSNIYIVNTGTTLIYNHHFKPLGLLTSSTGEM